MASTISTFTKSGKRLAGTSSGISPANLGKEIDGKIYQHPRKQLEPLSGSRVTVTNPAGSSERGRNRRTAGLGMGNAQIQRGINRDIPGQTG